jgi:hypothetical protein
VFKEVSTMAINGKEGNGRIGAVKGRSQFKDTNGNWIKRDTATGRFMDQKTSSSTHFKGVRKERE